MTLTLLNAKNLEKTYSFNRYDQLNSYPNYLWKIERGLVKVSTYCDDGNLIFLGLWGEGDFVSKMFGKIEPYHLTCLTKVTATVTPFDDHKFLTNILLEHLEQMQQLTLIRSYKRLDLMLIKLLKWLGQKFGQETKTGNLIDLRLTHQDLADILGSTRVPITKCLNQLEQQGLIERLSLQRIILKEDEFWHYEI